MESLSVSKDRPPRRLSAWVMVAGIAAIWMAAHITAFLEAGNLFNADAAVAGIQAFVLAQKGIFPIFLANQSYMGMAPAWLAAVLVKWFGPHLWTLTLAWAVPGALAFGLIIDGLDRYVSRGAAVVFVLIAMFMALAPLNTLRPSGHVMGLLGAAILLRWILRYRDISSLPVRALSFLGFGMVIGFFWYSDEIIIAALIPFAVMLVWAWLKAPRPTALLAGLAGVVGLAIGYLPAIIYQVRVGHISLHTGISSPHGMFINIHTLLQAFAWGIFSVPYAHREAELAAGLLVLGLSALFLFWTPWETLQTRILVLSPLYVNMVLYVASTMPIDMYSIRYLYPGLYTLGLATAIFVAAHVRPWWSWAKRPVVPAAAAALVLLAMGYDGSSFYHGVTTVGHDATLTAAYTEAHWLVRHHDPAGWGYYWDVYMLDLVAWPHLAYAANSNLNVTTILDRAESYCDGRGSCTIVLNAKAPPGLYNETPIAYSPVSVGELRYGRLIHEGGGYFMYHATVVSTDSPAS